MIWNHPDLNTLRRPPRLSNKRRQSLNPKAKPQKPKARTTSYKTNSIPQHRTSRPWPLELKRPSTIGTGSFGRCGRGFFAWFVEDMLDGIWLAIWMDFGQFLGCGYSNGIWMTLDFSRLILLMLVWSLGRRVSSRSEYHPHPCIQVQKLQVTVILCLRVFDLPGLLLFFVSSWGSSSFSKAIASLLARFKVASRTSEASMVFKVFVKIKLANCLYWKCCIV